MLLLLLLLFLAAILSGQNSTTPSPPLLALSACTAGGQWGAWSNEPSISISIFIFICCARFVRCDIKLFYLYAIMSAPLHPLPSSLSLPLPPSCCRPCPMCMRMPTNSLRPKDLCLTKLNAARAQARKPNPSPRCHSPFPTQLAKLPPPRVGPFNIGLLASWAFHSDFSRLVRKQLTVTVIDTPAASVPTAGGGTGVRGVWCGVLRIACLNARVPIVNMNIYICLCLSTKRRQMVMIATEIKTETETDICEGP